MHPWAAHAGAHVTHVPVKHHHQGDLFTTSDEQQRQAAQKQFTSRHDCLLVPRIQSLQGKARVVTADTRCDSLWRLAQQTRPSAKKGTCSTSSSGQERPWAGVMFVFFAGTESGGRRVYGNCHSVWTRHGSKHVDGVTRLAVSMPDGYTRGLERGASMAVNSVCLSAVG